MSYDRDKLKDTLEKLSKSRKPDFAEYIEGSVFDYFYIKEAKLKDDVLKVNVKLLPFFSEDLTKDGRMVYLTFIAEHIEDIVNTDLNNPFSVRKTTNLLNIRFNREVKDNIKVEAVENIQGKYDAFKAAVGLRKNIDVVVNVVDTLLITDEVVKFIIHSNS